MITINSEFINFSHKRDKISELEHKFDQLYEIAVELSADPNSQEYQRVKKELINVYEEKDRLLRGTSP